MGYFSDPFGPTLFGGDPTPYLWMEVDAEVTNRARAFLARGLLDGTSIQVTHFSVGTGGLDLFNYHVTVPVNPDASDLDHPLHIPPMVIDYYEKPNAQAACCYCILDTTECNDILSEIALWATVKWSPYLSEIGTVFCAAIAHFPLCAKNDTMRYGLRVNVQF